MFTLWPFRLHKARGCNHYLEAQEMKQNILVDILLIQEQEHTPPSSNGQYHYALANRPGNIKKYNTGNQNMPKVQYPTIQGKKRPTSFTAPWIGIKEKGVFPPMNHWYLKDKLGIPELPLLFWKENSHWQGNSSEGCTMKAFSKEYPGGILSAHWFTRNLIVEAVYKALT